MLAVDVKQCGPTTRPRVARGPPQRFSGPQRIQEKSSNLKFVEKRVRLHLSH